MERSCEYIEQAVADSRQGVIQLWGWAWGKQLLAVKNKLVTKIHKKPLTWTDSLDKRPRPTRKKTRIGEKRNAYGILVGKSEGKRPLGRPRRRLVDNIKINLREIGWDGVELIGIGTSGGLL
jgi:hypothetical protein